MNSPEKKAPVALSIAGTDPSGGAGVNVDTQVFRDFGFHGAAAITAVVWQNTQGVRGWRELEPRELREQMRAVADDFDIKAVKVGMVPTGDLILEVRNFLESLDESVPVVFDPVMVGGSGDRALMAPTGRRALESLSRVAGLVTPNGDEAKEMLGNSKGSQKPQALVEGLLQCGWERVLLKGGHLRADPKLPVVDWYGDEAGVVELKGVEPVEWDVRGTGCQLSSAIAVERAQGKSWLEAVEAGRAYLQKLLATRTSSLGKGRPMIVRVSGDE